MKGTITTGKVASDLRQVTQGETVGTARDRVAQAYLGQWGTERTIERVRNRIHWIAAQVKGPTVLDIGTSEGILPILLAREGFRTTGIDTNDAALAFAKTLLSAEPAAVQARVAYRHESLVEHVADALYDTVVLGEVIEHVGHPRSFLDRALACLAEGGRLVLTTPFGILPDRDHRHSFYLSDVRLLAAGGAVEALSVEDGYIRLVLRKDSEAAGQGDPGLSDARLLALSEEAFHAVQANLFERLEALLEEIGRQRHLLDAGEGREAEARSRLDEVREGVERTAAEIERLTALVGERDRTLGELRATNATLAARLAEAERAVARTEATIAHERRRGADADRALAGFRTEIAAAAPDGEVAGLVNAAHGATIALSFEPAVFVVTLTPGRHAEFVVAFADGGEPRAKRDAVAIIRCLDAAGAPIRPPYAGLQTSEKVGAYRYLDPSRVHGGRFRFGFTPPEGTGRIEIGFRRWAKEAAPVVIVNRVGVVNSGVRAALRRERSVTVPATPAARAAVAPAASAIRVATILDEFSFGSFRPEFDAAPLDPDSWEETFEKHRPQIFFCESAWSGADPVRRPWKGKIYGSVRFPKENRTALIAILDRCRREGIPTVFWNKEDPAHYPDRVHDFVDTARRFDTVFTTAAECVEGYRREHGCVRVFALPFATQPRLFNPIETGRRSSNIVFAGSWYAQHRQRSIDMETMLDRLVADGFTLEIVDRHSGTNDTNHHFPERYHRFMRAGVPHGEMAAVYKSSRFGLNFNTVTDSPTMFARRVFELMSSNTLVVSNHSRGMEAMFGDAVVFADRDPHRLRSLGDAEIDALRERALDTVLRHHTYRHRWEEILRSSGFAFTPPDETLTVVCPVATRDEAAAAIRAFDQQGYAGARLLLLVAGSVPDIEVAGYYQAFNRFGVTVTSMAYVDRYAPARQIPIDTRNAVIAKPGALPPAAWVERALLHLSYADDHVLSAASGGGDRYRLVAGRADQPLVGRSTRLAGLDPAAVPETVYCV